MTLARLCGIDTAAFGLVRLANGMTAYRTRRLNREDNTKHMVDFCQLTDRRTSRKYYGSHEQIAHAMRRYATAAGQDVVRFYEIVFFAFLIGNSDMHLKNFSLLREHDGTWHLSPARTSSPLAEDSMLRVCPSRFPPMCQFGRNPSVFPSMPTAIWSSKSIPREHSCSYNNGSDTQKRRNR
ncbi:MAG: HipA domain-containing protein [Kiritimatiellae bacterium]|nr:HipA domain-containing protein [Kiritimatiellia bacterium]